MLMKLQLKLLEVFERNDKSGCNLADIVGSLLCRKPNYCYQHLLVDAQRRTFQLYQQTKLAARLQVPTETGLYLCFGFDVECRVLMKELVGRLLLRRQLVGHSVPQMALFGSKRLETLLLFGVDVLRQKALKSTKLQSSLASH